jgi:hypothetical protein
MKQSGLETRLDNTRFMQNPAQRDRRPYWATRLQVEPSSPMRMQSLIYQAAALLCRRLIEQTLALNQANLVACAVR